MAEVVATAVVEEAVQSCFAVIGHYISYIRQYKRNIEGLQVELKKIEDTENTILKEVCTAENNAEDIRQDVQGWLKRCEELKSKVDELFETARPFRMSCLCCSCPNLKYKYLVSSEAAEMTSLITQHLEEGKFDKVGQRPQLGQLPLLSPGDFHGFGSRMVIINEVMDGLKDDIVSVIGVCGMGGIGKTTLVKEIAEKVKSGKLFDEVAFVVVSQDENKKAIQDQLASRLGLKSIANEMDIQGRAELLYKRLMDEKKKILVILDDVWQEINLRSVGIPVHGDRKGFKIIMTSRLDSVCADMKVQKRLQVGMLSKDEAWNLFKMTAEISDDNFPEKAEEVSEECAGLPLAIVTVGKSLRNKTEHAYRDVLRKLRNGSRTNTSRIHDVLYSCIKSSYDYLESDEHRSLLLLCSAFPEDYDIPVEHLVRYSRGLFDTFQTMGKARDRVEAIIDELMKCYLLLPGARMKGVKLHDVVRDLCLSIASKSVDVHISLKFEDLQKRLPGMKSRRLLLLRLVNYLSLKKTIQKEMNFSEEMEELRVLELNRITTRLLSSLPFMTNLQTLLLYHCRLLGDFAGIGSLKKLRVLSFFHSVVENFPAEIAELTNLQCLDLRIQMKRTTTLPLMTLSSLKKLEELYLGDIVSGDIESLKEVRSLSKLHTIQFVVEDDTYLEVLLRNLNLSKVIRFDIARVRRCHGETEYQIRENVLELRGLTDVALYLLKELMMRVKWLYLDGLGLTNVVDVIREDSELQNLKELFLWNCDMKYLVDATNHLVKGVFRKLETIEIKYASQLEELIPGDHPLGTLSGLHELKLGNSNLRRPFQCPLGNLRKLIIYKCDRIKYLFSKSMLNCLRHLDHINVQSCPVFERIVKSETDEEVACSEVLHFQILRHLYLDNLPRFRSLMPGSSLMASFNQVMLPKLEQLTIKFRESIKEIGGESALQEVCFSLGSSLPSVRYLDICECRNLFTVAKFGLLHGFQDLETLTVLRCLSIEFVFDFEEIKGHISRHLDQLRWLYLDSLPNLKHVWRMIPKDVLVFGNLKMLRVHRCGALRYLLTPTVTNMLVHLEEIDLVQNKLMEGIIGWGEINEPGDGEEFLLGKIVLPNLKSLKVRELPSFRKLCCCSPDVSLEVPSLSKLDISFMVEDILTRDHISGLVSLSYGKIGDRRYPITPSSAKLLLRVQELELCYDKQIEAILGSDEPGGEEATKKSVALFKLRKLKINNLRNFRSLCFSPDLNLELPSLTELHIVNSPVDILTRETRAPRNLTKIKIENCGSFKYLLSSSVEVLAHLEELTLHSNKEMEAIFGTGSLDVEEIPTRIIVLPKLRELEISKLGNFRMLCCSLNLNVNLPSLTELRIRACPKMIKFCAGQLSAPQLKDVNYGCWSRKKVDLGTFTNSWLKDCESMTRCLDCSFYENETCCHLDYQNI